MHCKLCALSLAKKRRHCT